MSLKKSMTLQQIMEKVARLWEFNDEKYPEMKGRSPDEQKIMALRHIAWRALKIQPLVGFIEKWEHGKHPSKLDPLYHNELLGVARKMVFNGLRLLEILGEQGKNLQWWLTNPE